MEKMVDLDLNQEYQREILGLGEIYEILSVNRKRLLLKKKFKQGRLFLASNKDHGGRGFSLTEIKKKVISHYPQKKILDAGYVDCPPWVSTPRELGKRNKIIYNKSIVFLAKAIFNFLIFFEPFLAKPKTAHMVYVLGRKK